MIGEGGSAADTRKRVRREFIRTHHPDVGGDTARFVAGLESLRRMGNRYPEAEDSTDPRFDGPIVVVMRPAGLRGLPVRFAEWRTRRRRPPRVH